mmetsp:Transcript_21761/g.39006  ORF Transcript_21761/g.39006 Transcript_21761/m.39006 type:complete len:171 (+) Transcript_21761:445-957(+)
MGGHLEKVTAAHQLCIEHARDQRFGRVAVIEEDFTTGTDCTVLQVQEDDAVSFVHNDDATLIRLAHWWYYPTPHCDVACICTRVNSAMCKTYSGCVPLRSSAGYIIQAGGFDAFLAAKGIIDTLVLGAIPSILMLPPLGEQAYQGAFHSKEDTMASQDAALAEFKAKCVH